jgi:hypothetical protein
LHDYADQKKNRYFCVCQIQVSNAFGQKYIIYDYEKGAKVNQFFEIEEKP